MSTLCRDARGMKQRKVIAMDENACIHNGVLAPSVNRQLRITFAIIFQSGTRPKDIIRALSFEDLLNKVVIPLKEALAQKPLLPSHTTSSGLKLEATPYLRSFFPRIQKGQIFSDQSILTQPSGQTLFKQNVDQDGESQS